MLEDNLTFLISKMDVLVSIAIVIILLVVLYELCIRLIKYLEKMGNFPSRMSSIITKILRYLLVVAVILTILSFLGVNLASVFMSVGIVSLAITLAAKDIISNILSGIIIILEKRFEKGDMIEIGGYLGQVKKIGLRTVELYHKKKLIVIPNVYFTTKPFINYTKQGYYGIFFDIMILNKYVFDDKIAEIENILKKSDLILKDPPYLIMIKNIRSNGVEVKIKVYIDNPDNDTKTISALITEIKRNVLLEDAY